MSEAGTMPCGHKKGGRNLIVCIDGTANQFGDKNTNVIELYNLILKERKDNQFTWYNSGIGTYAEPQWKSPAYWEQVVVHWIDTAIACAYELYRHSDTNPGQMAAVGPGQATVSKAERFKRAFSRKDVKVHFVGAWDTVSSIGTVRGTKMLPGTTDGMGHVCFFRHALALDERRVKFLPEFAYGGSTICPKQLSEWTHVPRPTESEQTPEEKCPGVLEVWFAGTHSDIGGGNVNNLGMDRSRPPLRWMVLEAVALGLRAEPFKQELTSEQQIEFQESLTGIWPILEWLPLRRLTFSRERDGKKTTKAPHRGRSRKIHWGQKIHSSLILASTPYNPKARPPPQSGASPTGEFWFWDQLREDGLKNTTGWLEIDISDYSTARRITRMFIGGETGLGIRECVQEIAATEDSVQALYDEITDMLFHRGNLQPEDKFRLLNHAVDLLKPQSTHLQLIPLLRICHLLDDLRASDRDDYKKVANDFLSQLTDRSASLEFKGHTNKVWCAVFSPDSKLIFSGGHDGDPTIRVWDAYTDHKRIVSCSRDNTIRIWDIETRKQAGEPLRGHSNTVASIVISPDGKLIVSGSYDKTIRIWDADTGTQVGQPLQGHTDRVQSVAISPDGKRAVSGGNDNTIRIWELETGEQVGEPLVGHTDWVLSVAISPDGKRIVSGSKDSTIQIWDIGTREQVGEPLQEHTYWVYSVAISPDGRRIASGSGDKTVRLWDMEDGSQIGEPLRRHTDHIFSVAFSPDGKSIVSGSADKTARIWNTEGILAGDKDE
ncbi:hypothetical protein MD484_g249, partial [Candolleomyces efflorescens]